MPDATAACSIFHPTYWKASWPDDAITQAKANNAAGKALCGPTWK